MKKYVKPEIDIVEVSSITLLAQSRANIGIDRTHEADNGFEALSNEHNPFDLWDDYD